MKQNKNMKQMMKMNNMNKFKRKSKNPNDKKRLPNNQRNYKIIMMKIKLFKKKKLLGQLDNYNKRKKS